MIISDLMAGIRQVRDGLVGKRQLTPPPIVTIGPLLIEQLRAKISDIAASAPGMPSAEFYPLVEPYLRSAAAHGEPTDRIVLANILMHKAVWLETEAGDPIGAILSAVEGLLSLGRMADQDVDEATAPYREWCAASSEVMRHHVRSVLSREAAGRRIHEPEVLIAELQQLNVEGVH